MKILKFGGSSVKTVGRIKNVGKILQIYFRSKTPFTVVFSAFGGITDLLIEMSGLAAKGEDSYKNILTEFINRHDEIISGLFAEGPARDLVLKNQEENNLVLSNLLLGILLVREASPRTMDYVLSFGERNSAYIIAEYIKYIGEKAEFLDTRNIIKTDKTFGNAAVDFELTNEKITAHFKKNLTTQIVTGFISSAKGGLTTTLGRGGSDFTAAILGAALNALQIEIWTDVDGVLTANPGIVSHAFTIPTLTYAEAMEMSHFGAKVIYPPTIQPALNKEIPVFIKNTFNPQFPGTKISNDSQKKKNIVKGVSSIRDISLITLQGSGMVGVPGIAARLFNSLASYGINVVMITQGSSEHSISFVVDSKNESLAKKVVSKAFEHEIKSKQIEPVQVENNLCTIAIIGENMRFQPGIAGQLFLALGKNGINVIAIAQGSSELNISVVIHKEDELKAVNSLHDAFFLSGTRVLNLFIIGVGLIGKTLLKQISQQQHYLKVKNGLDIRVIGLANSKKMIFEPKGIDLNSWGDILKSSLIEMDIDKYTEKMCALNLGNTIFIDNTSAQQVSDKYHSILDHSISIATPNKLAASSDYLTYSTLLSKAKSRKVKFLYETNVGAGLPVISTLKNLKDSGDEIISIEAVLSGSLSYIFNKFDGSSSFHDVVMEAKEKGYTEPDPRMDLECSDIRRKVVILSREAGWQIEPDEVKIEHFLSEKSRNASTVDDFFRKLNTENLTYKELVENSLQEGKRLRVIAHMERGSAVIKLQPVDISNPFYSLQGSDNMIVFRTSRYDERPLVVRGPGAGAEVTAAGVLAEVISIGNYLI